MENELMRQENQLKAERNIEIVTTEIKTLCKQAMALALSYAIEIGRRLDEAKGMLSHGEWSEWLKNEVDFSQSTANNYMKLFEEYGDKQFSIFGAELNSQSFGNLSYTKALKLLSIPADEREEFAEKNNVEELSVRDLDKIIKERDEAIKRAEELEEIEAEKKEIESHLDGVLKEVEDYKVQYDNATDEIENLKASLEKVKANEKKVKDKLKELKENPEISDEAMQKITLEAEEKAAEKAKAEIEEKIADATKKCEDALKAKESAEENLSIAQSRVEELEKKVLLADPKATEFKVLFDVVQTDVIKLEKALDAISDEEMREKFKKAICAVFERFV